MALLEFLSDSPYLQDDVIGWALINKTAISLCVMALAIEWCINVQLVIVIIGPRSALLPEHNGLEQTWWLVADNILEAFLQINIIPLHPCAKYVRADSRFSPSQWEMVLLCNHISLIGWAKPRISPVCVATWQPF